MPMDSKCHSLALLRIMQWEILSKEEVHVEAVRALNYIKHLHHFLIVVLKSLSHV